MRTSFQRHLWPLLLLRHHREETQCRRVVRLARQDVEADCFCIRLSPGGVMRGGLQNPISEKVARQLGHPTTAKQAAHVGTTCTLLLNLKRGPPAYL
jgi:hypothetical protein